MNFGNDTDEILKNRDGNTSVTPATVLLHRRIGTSPAPRMLTPYEIDLLRQSKREIDQVEHEVFARKNKRSQT